MSISRKKGILPALTLAALMALGSVGVSAPASAQSIFASPQAAHAAGVNSYSGGGGYYQPHAMQANDTGTGTPDPGAGSDVYSSIFAQIQTAVTAIIAGPGAKAFGILILGLAFGIAWRLVTKGTKSVAK